MHAMIPGKADEPIGDDDRAALGLEIPSTPHRLPSTPQGHFHIATRTQCRS